MAALLPLLLLPLLLHFPPPLPLALPLLPLLPLLLLLELVITLSFFRFKPRPRDPLPPLADDDDDDDAMLSLRFFFTNEAPSHPPPGRRFLLMTVNGAVWATSLTEPHGLRAVMRMTNCLGSAEAAATLVPSPPSTGAPAVRVAAAAAAAAGLFAVVGRWLRDTSLTRHFTRTKPPRIEIVALPSASSRSSRSATVSLAVRWSRRKRASWLSPGGGWGCCSPRGVEAPLLLRSEHPVDGSSDTCRTCSMLDDDDGLPECRTGSTAASAAARPAGPAGPAAPAGW